MPTVPQNQPTQAPSGPAPAAQQLVTDDGTQLDPSVVKLMQGIKQVESGGNYNAVGKSGEFGAYQWMPGNYQAAAQQYGVDPNDTSPAAQNKVAYYQLLNYKNQGLSPEQTAAAWNAGDAKALDGSWQTNIGTNKYGVAYNTPAYVQKVIAAAQGQQPPNLYAQQNIPAPQPSIGGFAGNVVQSGANFLGNLGNAILHPIQTVQNIGSAAVGGLQELGGQQNQNTATFDTIKDFYKQRYGSPQAILNTIYTDPVGFLGDLSAVAGGVGGAAGIAARGADVAGIADAADVARSAATSAGRVSELTNPLSPIGAGLSKIAGSNIGAQAANFATGGGTDAALALYRAAQEGGDAAQAARQGLSGAIDTQDILHLAIGASDDVINQGEAAATEHLNNAIASGHSLDVSPIFSALEDNLTKFGLADDDGNPFLTEDGKLDFSNTPFRFDKPEQDRIQTIFNEMQRFGLKAGQRTPEGLQSLKRAFGSLYSPNSDVRAFVTSMKSSVRKVLGNVEGYDQSMEQFQDTYKLQDDIQSALSVGGNAKADTIIRKLIGTLRSNDPFRVSMLQKLNEASGRKLIPSIAGYSYSPYFSRNLVGKVGELTGVAQAIHGLLNPGTIAMFAATSPRLIGEFIMALGGTAEQATKFSAVISSFKRYSAAITQLHAATGYGAQTAQPLSPQQSPTASPVSTSPDDTPSS